MKVRIRVLISICIVAAISGELQAVETPPNIVFILCDDLAQGDLGCYGQKLIQTPNLDRMAAEGTRYTQAYCGTSVCAPSRASFMTGLHTGHSPIRANREIPAAQSAFGAGQLPLSAETVTVAEVLKQAGYSTACMGKWGMGQFDTSGSPLKQGFDRFYGYNGQVHAHDYFPTYLCDGERRVELPENAGGAKKTYAQDLIQREVISWVREQKDQPFFLFYAATLPHGKFEIDDLGIYRDREGWSDLQKTYAAMVTRLDSDVGELMAVLKETGVDDRTLVLFAGDNGASFAPDSPVGKHFDQSMGGKLRGHKRSMYEGGLRQAAMARWPGKVPAGRVSEEPWAVWDILPTAAELAGVEVPPECPTDGLSLVSFLTGGPAPQREYFYWELHEKGSIQAVRFGDWKAIRNFADRPIELYNLADDSGERNDLASDHPDLVTRAEQLMREARVENANFPLKLRDFGDNQPKQRKNRSRSTASKNDDKGS